MKTAFKAIFEGLRTEVYCGYSGWKGSTEGCLCGGCHGGYLYQDIAKAISLCLDSSDILVLDIHDGAISCL